MELIDIYKDYGYKFDGKICNIKTNYSKMSDLKVIFKLHDLHHLLGLHKVTSHSASESTKLVLNEDLNLANLSKKSGFDEVRTRIDCYSLIERIFYHNKVQTCIIRKDINPNTMSLDLVFVEYKSRDAYVLGLRTNKNDILVPTTLHKGNAKRYKNSKITKVNQIEWLS